MQIYFVVIKVPGVRQPPAPRSQAVGVGGNEVHLTVRREKGDLSAGFPGVLQGECLGLCLAGLNGFTGKCWCHSHVPPSQ